MVRDSDRVSAVITTNAYGSLVLNGVVFVDVKMNPAWGRSRIDWRIVSARLGYTAGKWLQARMERTSEREQPIWERF
jgi:hypothetical protein